MCILSRNCKKYKIFGECQEFKLLAFVVAFFDNYLEYVIGGVVTWGVASR